MWAAVSYVLATCIFGPSFLRLSAAAAAAAAAMEPAANLSCDPCIDRPSYNLRAIVHGTSDDAFWLRMRAASVQAATDMRIQLDFELYDTFDPDRMASDILEAAATAEYENRDTKRPDALVVTIPSPIVEEAVAKALEMGMPVFGMNSGYDVAEAAGVMGFVAMDEYLGGKAAAEEFVKAFDANANPGDPALASTAITTGGNSTDAAAPGLTISSSITRAAFINHQKGNSALEARRNGFVDGLATLGDQILVDEIIADLADTSNDPESIVADLQSSFEGCPYDVILLSGEANLEVATSALYSAGCILAPGQTLLGSFDTGEDIYASIATGRLAFAISQQSHLQGTLSIVFAATYVTTGKKLARAAESDSEYGIWLSGPQVINLRNLPSDTLQVCEEDAFPVCPNTLDPDGITESRCRCTDRSEIVIAGVLHGVTTDAFWDIVFDQAAQAADDLGVTLRLDRLEPQPSDEVWHAKMANKMISYCREGVDGLFITIPSDNVVAAIKECQALNVPVISVNTGAELAVELGLVHHISQLEYSAGFGAGQRLSASGITEGMCLNYAAGNSALAERCQGFEDALLENGIQYVGMVMVPRDNEIIFVKNVEEALPNRGEDDAWDGVGILTVSTSVIPETLVVKERHPSVLIGSFDTSEGLFNAIDQGKVLFGIDQNPFVQGYMPVWILSIFAQTKQNLRNTFIETGPAFIEVAPDEALTACVANNFEVCDPPVTYSLNQLNTIRPVGLTFAAIIFLSSLVFGGWTLVYRNQPVVKKSQPIFLCMICVGTFLMGSTIIPLSIDDSIATPGACTKACMAAPWLFCIGFTTAFAAVFSKIWRLNRLLASSKTFRRTKLEVKDVLAPFVMLLTLNIIFLLVWSLVDPMYWERKPIIGSEDGLSSFGVCNIGRTGVSIAMISCLIVLALSVVILANYEAYKARKVSIEYSESKYVALAMICFLQVIVVGVPLIALVHTNPPAGYFVKVAIITVLSLSLLFLIFIPKMYFMKDDIKKQKEREERKKKGVTSVTSYASSNSAAESSSALRIISTGSTTMASSGAKRANLISRSHVANLHKVLSEEAGMNSIGPTDFDALLKKAGIGVDDEHMARRDSAMSRLSTETARRANSVADSVASNTEEQEQVPKSVGFEDSVSHSRRSSH